MEPGQEPFSSKKQNKSALQESGKREAEVSVSLKTNLIQRILGDFQLNRAIRTRDNT
jgi:hypothetical protein